MGVRAKSKSIFGKSPYFLGKSSCWGVSCGKFLGRILFQFFSGRTDFWVVELGVVSSP